MRTDPAMRAAVDNLRTRARPTRVTAAATATIHTLNSFRRQARSRSPSRIRAPSPHLNRHQPLQVLVRKNLKLTVSRETFLARLGIAVRGASTRSADPDARRRPDPRGRRPRRAPGHRHGARPPRARWRPTAPRPARPSCPAGCCSTWSARCRRTTSRSSTGAREQDVEVISGPAKFHLRTLPPEDFPKLPEPPARAASAASRPARSSTRSPAWPAPPRGTRRGPHLTGVLVTASGDELRMVATDSYRLGVKETKLETAARRARSRRTCRPGRCRSSAASPRRAAPSTIDVAALENQVIFTVDDVVLSSRLVEGRFPNYQQLLPETYEHELRVEPRRAARGGAPRRPARAEERAAAAALRRGRAGRVGADARRRRGERVAAGPVHRRGARDRLQPGVLPRRPRERRVGRADPEADQPAAARA